MSRTLTALGLSAALSVFAAGAVLAEPVAYDIDPSHSAAAFQYSHAGFSTTFGQISGVTGVVTLDTQNPANSAVEAKLADPDLYARDPGAFDRLSAQADTLRAELQAAEERWLEVAEKAEALG